jgi:hypothetical protein
MIQEGNDFSGAVSEIEWERFSRLTPVLSAANSQPQWLKPQRAVTIREPPFGSDLANKWRTGSQGNLFKDIIAFRGFHRISRTAGPK